MVLMFNSCFFTFKTVIMRNIKSKKQNKQTPKQIQQ